MSGTDATPPEDPEIDPDLATREEVQRVLAEGSGVVVDIMNADSYRKNHIPGAIHLPLLDLPLRARKVLREPTKPVLVYCGGYS